LSVRAANGCSLATTRIESSRLPRDTAAMRHHQLFDKRLISSGKALVYCSNR
jgi:hypothetical protein